MHHGARLFQRLFPAMKKKSLQLDIDPVEGVVPVSRAAATFSKLVRWVRERHKPIYVTHQGYAVAVLVDAETFRSLVELASQAQEDEGEAGDSPATG